MESGPVCESDIIDLTDLLTSNKLYYFVYYSVYYSVYYTLAYYNSWFYCDIGLPPTELVMITRTEQCRIIFLSVVGKKSHGKKSHGKKNQIFDR